MRERTLPAHLRRLTWAFGLAALVLFPACGGKSNSSTAPVITSQPANLSVDLGATASFSAAASGNPAPTLLWQRTVAGIWTDLPWATSATYTCTPVQADDGAQFRMVATNSAGSATSNAATLTVIPPAPVITAAPAGTSVTVGQTATFSVTATGTGTLTYAWQRSNDNGSTWAAATAGSGAATATYVTAATVIGDNGAEFRVLVTNAGGTTPSAAATLTVTAIPTGAGATFAAGPAMTVNRMGQAAVALSDGRTVLFGGHGSGFVSLSSADLLNAAGTAFTALSMNFPHDGGAVARLANGKYLLAGGAQDLGVSPGYASAEVFDPSTNAFTATAGSMAHARMLCSAATLASGKVLIAGGWYEAVSPAYGELYDPASGTFTATGALNTPRAAPILLPTNDGKAVLFGGYSIYGGSSFEQVELFDPATNSFSVLQSTLFTGESGWAINYTSTYSPFDGQRLADGRTLLTAVNSGTSQQVLFTFDPATKSFAKFGTALSNAQDSFLCQPVVDTASGKAYLTAQRLNVTGFQICLYTVNLGTGAFTVPTATYTLPASTYLITSGYSLASGPRVLISGGTTANDYNTNFQPIAGTLFATPSY